MRSFLVRLKGRNKELAFGGGNDDYAKTTKHGRVAQVETSPSKPRNAGLLWRAPGTGHHPDATPVGLRRRTFAAGPAVGLRAGLRLVASGPSRSAPLVRVLQPSGYHRTGCPVCPWP